MTEVKVETVAVGDVIVEYGKRIVVLRIDRNPFRCPNHVHVNDSLCWDKGSPVTVDR